LNPAVPTDTQTSSPPPTLELRAISKRFGAVQALDDVSVGFRGGAVTALVGENGAGKSTLAAVACGLVSPDGGSVAVEGEELEISSPADAFKHGLRIAPQELVLCPDLSVAENICLGQWPVSRSRVLDRREMHRIAHQRLQSLGVENLPTDAQVEQLKLVDKTMVQIARAMAPGAKVLVVDEPTAPMSATEAGRLLDLLRRITDSGVATIYVSHKLDEVFSLADRAVVLRDGRLVVELERDEISREALVRGMIGSRSLAESSPGTGSGRIALEVEALSTENLDLVDLSVEAGEVAAVYGIAGSGRDELGSAIAGVVRPLTGRVRLGGKEVPPGSLRAAIDAGLGYVPAERRSQGLVLEMPIRENISLALLRRLSRFGVLKRAEERQLAEDWVERLAIATPTIEKQVGQLSGGSQQKVLLARWLARDCGVLVLEEPTRGIDIGTKRQLYSVLHGLAAEGMAVLVISSDLEEVVTVASRVLVVRRGRIVAELERPTEEAVVAATTGSAAIPSKPTPIGGN
jgi:ABC-type sugar transport system ATPase subunit